MRRECNYTVWYAPAVRGVVREEKRAQYLEKGGDDDSGGADPHAERRAGARSRSRPAPSASGAAARAGMRSAAAATRSEPQPLPDRRGQRRLIQRVEVQPRRAAREQAVAELGDHVEPERADRRRRRRRSFRACCRIQRGISAPQASEKRASFEKLRDRHDAGHDRHRRRPRRGTRRRSASTRRRL